MGTRSATSLGRRAALAPRCTAIFVAYRVARLLWLATVVWVATHPTVPGVALVIAATTFVLWADRARHPATSTGDDRPGAMVTSAS